MFSALLVSVIFISSQASSNFRNVNLINGRKLYANPAIVNLGSTVEFAVLAGSEVTNSGDSTLKGDLGVWPGSTAIGMNEGDITGKAYIADPEGIAQAAQGSLTVAKNDAASRASNQVISTDLGGLTLPPGVFTSASTMILTGTLYLDAGGDENACWIFQMGSALTVEVGSNVVIINGNSPHDNVFWNVGSSAEIKTGATIKGAVLAGAGIAVGLGASTGPLLASSGAVTLLDNTVTAYGYKAPKSSLSDGEIAGIVIGTIVGVILVGMLIFFLMYGMAALIALLTCQSCSEGYAAPTESAPATDAATAAPAPSAQV